MSRGATNLAEKQQWMREKHSQAPGGLVPIQSAFTERHFTVAEIAAMWNISPDSTRRIFEREPGVLVLNGNNSSRHTRGHKTLRIPESVAARVHRRLSNVRGL